MLSVILKIVCVLVLVALIASIVLAAYQSVTFKPNMNPPAVSEDFTNPSLPNWTLKLVDGAGVAKAPPYHGGSVEAVNGTLRLQISPDSNFSNESGNWQEGLAAAPQYNNAFAIGMPDFAPTRTQKVVAEFQMKIDPGYQGSTGLWIEARNTFDKNGIMVSGGFPGAIGVSFVGGDSTKIITGMKFEYVKGFMPLCIGNVSGIDPTDWNTYQIKWEKVLGFLDKFDLFVNGQHNASCYIPFIGFQHSEIQVWADNYKIGDQFQLGYLNPDQLQGTMYKDLRIWTEEK